MIALSYVKTLFCGDKACNVCPMTKENKVTLAEVAARAGVSAITVSRALRKPDMVSPALRDRIDESVRALGYVPDAAARALASGRTDVVGVIIPSVTNSVFADVLRGIYEAVDESGLSVQLGNTRYSPGMEEDILRVFVRQRPVGLIVAGIDQTETSRKLLVQAGCPVVQIMETGIEPVDMMVGFSHRDAARAATLHLLESGYKRPAFLGARMDPRTQRRFQGFREAAAAVGAFSSARVVTTPEPSTVSLGSRLLADLLARAPETDAVFCNNDDLALGVLFEAMRRNIPVPERLGICGFNDLEMMAAAEPPITSIRTHRYRMGSEAVAMIRERLTGADVGEPVRDIGFELMVRTSTRLSGKGPGG